MKRALQIFVMAFSGVLATGGAYAADQASFDALFAAAESSRAQAAELEYEWRDTAKLLENAKAAAAEGDFEKAEKLAAEAQRQGEAALKQAKLQEERWQGFVVK